MTTNDITGDALRTRPATDAHRQIESRPMLDESEWPDDESRIDHIGQNGGDGAHYAAVKL